MAASMDPGDSPDRGWDAGAVLVGRAQGVTTHQLRVGGTAHLGGRADRALAHEGKQLVADGGRGDRGRGPGGVPDLDVPGAYVAWFIAAGASPPHRKSTITS